MMRSSFIKSLILLSFFLIELYGNKIYCQDGTEIYLVPVGRVGNMLSMGAPVNITNRIGYDNQPAFTKDGKGLFFSSIREDEQADVFYYEIESQTTTQITSTTESEFSPTPWDGHEGFTLVRVEKDSSQLLWHYNPPNEPISLFPDIKNIGYHAWASDSDAVLFLLTDTFSLQAAHLGNSSSRLLANNIGRSIHKATNNSIYYVDKSQDKDWFIRKIELGTMKNEVVCKTLDGVEDFTIAMNGKIWMGKDQILYEFDPRKATDAWHQLCDFSTTPMGDFYRLAYSQKAKMLALVVYEKNPKK